MNKGQWGIFLTAAFDKLHDMPPGKFRKLYKQALRDIAGRAFDRRHIWSEAESEQLFMVTGGLQLHGLFKREEPDMLSNSDKTGEF